MKCACRIKIEQGKPEDDVFKGCLCSSGCQYCATRNLYRTDFVFKKDKEDK